MIWIFMAVIYYSIGIGVFVWLIKKDKKINPKSKIFPMKIFFLGDPVCLLWPFILFSEIKHRRKANNIGNNDLG